MGCVKVISFEFAPFPGGHGTYATEMCRSLAETGVAVSALVPDYGPSPDGAEEFRIVRRFRHQTLDRRAFAATRTFLKDGAADVVLCCDIRATLAATLAGSGTPLVAMFHGSEILKSERSTFAAVVNRLAVRGTCALVANSRYTAQLVEKHARKPCAAALLGVSDYWRGIAGDRFDHERLRQLDPADVVISTVARLEPRKGHFDALDALTAAWRQGAPPFTYVVAGKIEDEAYGREVLKRLQDAPFAGVYAGTLSRDDVRRLYARSACHLLPARAEPLTIEGFGLATIEAAAQGCPSIVTSVGGLPEAVIDGVTGFVVPERAIDQLAAKLLAVLQEPATREALRSGALGHARRSTWAETARATPVIRAVIERHAHAMNASPS